jgi:cytoskeletal protein CcmA (bactofilin family)
VYQSANRAGGVPVFSVDSNSKTDPNKLSPGRAGGAAPSSTRSFEPASTTGTASGTSVIGNDLTLLGEKITIISQNKLQVDGHVRGNVHGKQVLITEHGSVVGMVCAEKIEVRGAVRGSIRAVSVMLHSTAVVEGDIMHQTLGISEGAKFDGRVRRSSDTAELMPVLDPEAIASAEYTTSSEPVMD